MREKPTAPDDRILTDATEMRVNDRPMRVRGGEAPPDVMRDMTEYGDEEC